MGPSIPNKRTAATPESAEERPRQQRRLRDESSGSPSGHEQAATGLDLAGPSSTNLSPMRFHRAPGPLQPARRNSPSIFQGFSPAPITHGHAPIALSLAQNAAPTPPTPNTAVQATSDAMPSAAKLNALIAQMEDMRREHQSVKADINDFRQEYIHLKTEIDQIMAEVKDAVTTSKSWADRIQTIHALVLRGQVSTQASLDATSTLKLIVDEIYQFSEEFSARVLLFSDRGVFRDETMVFNHPNADSIMTWARGHVDAGVQNTTALGHYIDRAETYTDDTRRMGARHSSPLAVDEALLTLRQHPPPPQPVRVDGAPGHPESVGGGNRFPQGDPQPSALAARSVQVPPAPVQVPPAPVQVPPAPVQPTGTTGESQAAQVQAQKHD